MRFVIRILIWSLLVGVVLAWLGWTPAELLAHMVGLAGQVIGWSWPYVKQGAVIVVPLALIGLLVELVRRRRNRG